MPTSTRRASTLPTAFSAQDLTDKAEWKLAVQEEIGWAPDAKRAIICLPSGMTDELGGETLRALLPGLLTLPVALLIRGKGDASYGKVFAELEKRFPHRVHIMADADAAKLLAASDMALFLTEPKAETLKQCLGYGCIPVGPASEALEDYNPNQESGTAFTFEGETAWHPFAALVRALETFRFPYDWRTIMREAVEVTE
jgi:glycogen synthase